MPSKNAGAWLVVASLGFWISWALMPGVGVTDAAAIFALVGQHRTDVLASVILQLASAAAYAPGLAAVLRSDAAGRSRLIRAGCLLLLIGAMGSAADAVFHLVAYEMTAPNVALPAMDGVMRRLQGPDLALLLPFVLAFFAGHAALVTACRRQSRLAAFGFRALIAAPLLAVLGAVAKRGGFVPGRAVGLAVLAAIAASLALLGLSILSGAEPAARGTR